jgi:hypothetical protein
MSETSDSQLKEHDGRIRTGVMEGVWVTESGCA